MCLALTPASAGLKSVLHRGMKYLIIIIIISPLSIPFPFPLPAPLSPNPSPPFFFFFKISSRHLREKKSPVHILVEMDMVCGGGEVRFCAFGSFRRGGCVCSGKKKSPPPLHLPETALFNKNPPSFFVFHKIILFSAFSFRRGGGVVWESVCDDFWKDARYLHIMTGVRMEKEAQWVG